MRLLLLTGAELGAKMAGPAIRMMSIARVLAADGHAVTIATTSKVGTEFALEGVRLTYLKPGDRMGFRSLEHEAQVIVFQGHVMEQFPELARTERYLVADVYDPMHLEMLEQGREEPRSTWDELVSSRVKVLNQQLACADFILCASPRQRSFYLGHLAALGRVSPTTYAADPHLDRLIAVAPFGLEEQPPQARQPAMRGVVPGVEKGSRILLWGGGIYSWFDPITLIRATHALWQRKPHTRLVFLGTMHPGVPPMGAVKDAMAVAREIGALDTSVIFNEDWVPYDERGSYLVEADAGVSTHHAHLETEFAFRTRILDYLWAGLPMVVTDGDSFADLVEREHLGIVVPAGDESALEAALERALYDTKFAAATRARVQAIAATFTWEHTLLPLRDFVREPYRAADVVAARSRATFSRQPRRLVRRPLPPGLRRDATMAWHHLRSKGPGEVVRRYRMRRARG